jgi:hypothetical protein
VHKSIYFIEESKKVARKLPGKEEIVW